MHQAITLTASIPLADIGSVLAAYPGDVARGTSDHDPNVANFVFSLPPVVDAPTVLPEPSTEGNNVTASASFTDPDGSGDSPFTCTVDFDDGSGVQAGNVNGSTCTGQSHTYSTFGSYIVTVSVTDKFGVTGSNTAGHVVIFNWTGFFQPVDNTPALNVVKGGSAIPVKIQFTDCNGAVPVNLAPTISLTMVSGSTPGLPINEPISTSAADTTGIMRFSTNQYIYNLATKPLPDPSATYKITITIPFNGQTVTVIFGLRP